MTVLLDTHTLLWAKISPELLSRTAAGIIRNQNNVIFISAATAWEIATKVRAGKLLGAERIERDFLEMVEDSGFTLMPIEVAHGLRAGRFTAAHRDPFDRILAAQAMAYDIPIISRDKKLDEFSIRRIW